jgi:hypothetical protein
MERMDSPSAYLSQIAAIRSGVALVGRPAPRFAFAPVPATPLAADFDFELVAGILPSLSFDRLKVFQTALLVACCPPLQDRADFTLVPPFF